MFGLQKPLMYQSMLYIFSIKSFFLHIFEQILIQVFHHTIFYALTLELGLILLLRTFRHWKDLIKFNMHVIHELLDVLSLLLSVNIWLDYLGQNVLNKHFYLFSDGKCLFTFKLEIEVVEYTLLSLFFRLPYSRSLSIGFIFGFHICLFYKE